MSFPFAAAAVPDATRIAQTVVHRDVQTQVLVTSQIRRHAAAAERLPATTGGSGAAAHRERPRAARDPRGGDAGPAGGRVDLRA